ncbi:MAG: sensor histidine kinase [Prolixibacteraceae bacterium]|nr:sensor histidine kinase [Prolixibacteraceae bacterium]MBN2775435.1 sensor histidine kinase [Prolixibacteraceae bacterium]
MKTYSANRLSFLISLFITFLAALIFFIIYLNGEFSLFSFLTLPMFFIFSYLGVWYVLNIYIDNKIKPIYKAIYDPLKEQKRLFMKNSSENNINEARKEVEKWTKKQVRELERLKDLEKYRKEFVGNVSHELKTPIFNIQGYILTLMEGGIDDPKINKLYLERTERNIDRMISIVQDLESINKLESGELNLVFESFDIIKMVEEVFELEHMHAEEAKISLEFAKKPDTPIMVRGDKKRIMEVLTNLVVNAIKYGKKKGNVWISFYDMDENLMIEVRDDGIGIAKKDLPRIFERFYRVDKSRSREQGGTGLGLSIVKHIIEAHGQTINVKSVPAQGTTFTFTVEKDK